MLRGNVEGGQPPISCPNSSDKAQYDSITHGYNNTRYTPRFHISDSHTTSDQEKCPISITSLPLSIPLPKTPFTYIA
jgi:hypothetical protein